MQTEIMGFMGGKSGQIKELHNNDYFQRTLCSSGYGSC